MGHPAAPRLVESATKLTIFLVAFDYGFQLGDSMKYSHSDKDDTDDDSSIVITCNNDNDDNNGKNGDHDDNMKQEH